MNVKFERDISTVCSFSGYRPSKMPFEWDKGCEEYKALYKTLKEEIISLVEKGVKYFQTGMARGIDLMCGEIIIELKKEYDTELICVVPCLNQYNGWSGEDRKTYDRLIANSASVVQVTSDTYRNGCMQLRNQYLVDTAQYILAVFNGQSGGTMQTINYAKKQGRTIIMIDPTELSRTELIHGNEEGVLYYV